MLALMAMPRQNTGLLAHLLLLNVFCCGCVTHRDIQPSSQYPSDYLIGEDYQTKQILVGARDNTLLFRRHDTIIALPPKTFPTLSDIQARRKHFARDFVIIPANTVVRIERFDLERNVEAGIFVWIYGRFVGGPLASQKASLSLISRREGRSALEAQLLMVDTNFLEQVKHQ